MGAADRTTARPSLDRDAVRRIVEGRESDPFAVLGPHAGPEGTILRTFQPGAAAVEALNAEGAVLARLDRIDPAGLFASRIGSNATPVYRLRITWPGGMVQETEDPYAFPPLLGGLDLHLLGEGTHLGLADALGSHAVSVDGVAGVRFAVWAPNAARVSVVGDFNGWDGRRAPMRLHPGVGVWEIFLPRLGPGTRYKYEILTRQGNVLTQKADPVARAAEMPPATASVVPDPAPFAWTDDAWMAQRAARQTAEAPLSIYEVHAGSWVHMDGWRDPSWDELGDRLIPYATGLGFTHIELLPIMEHPFGGSWGYQPLGLFAPTARYGAPRDFARFIDRCHQAGLGVLLDWVPAHFPGDAHGLAQFDGTALYEHADPREGFHHDWNTLIYNFGRTEVSQFLVASALEWLRRYHIDGLRVDAVASMLYRDYSRKSGEWVPNIYGGRENLEAVAFLRRLNATITHEAPGAIVIAEESTAWPGVTQPIDVGGLGFAFKWNMGWMHDTLRYIGTDPIHRAHHHDDMTFGLVYAFSEHYVLPISHDEVVHGKGSLLGRMPGDSWQRMANLRAYLGFMWGHPGKKLLFQGCEIGQPAEWDHDGELPWGLLADPAHEGVKALVGDLNAAYRREPALHSGDARPEGFRWIIGDDRANSVFAFLRLGGGPPVLVVCNMTPVPRHDYSIGVPEGGSWDEIVNTDAGAYGGSGLGNSGRVVARAESFHGMEHSLRLTLPPLATLFLRPRPPE
ncbi:1,4-alpha-glucan branching protein GlgB [Aquabacter spiritensis]|uniref:1,4-alpha-glucan branching enzyme GlgB n=1 Tax=Aquabacter spiritensis TaxID=933073 RepID=A0A4R3LZ33_9HYPH|nr:1,4-alpha-glucan branching protein GlgB [Aquabacter spiritensis]TCT05536.1 1,4-alpha-glucan branching enzyme [Aquabacter spiritensis]